MKHYFVYIMSSYSKTLYIGVTNNLIRRVQEHKNAKVEGFTKRYNIKYLVYYEMTDSILSVIEREKQLKRWRREKKIKLIESLNSSWEDLSFCI
ncbi:GIY-YIG nuclease family protein [Patescibacteria group bacterium]|nr:GIY-YIG nuclease family protein [Patescibacteria group bacterium]MBU1075162.1 GIY-YIG nuclease family protein [Patescibacteria group bacterium]MBU1951460.1 GIY-YIG nuclease family protein [Patescibacteria group bacterium]